MGEAPEQGRFGPPPVVAKTMSVQLQPDGLWRLLVSVRREGQHFTRTVELGALQPHELVEAVATESYDRG